MLNEFINHISPLLLLLLGPLIGAIIWSSIYK
jgi:hypothetical protein